MSTYGTKANETANSTYGGQSKQAFGNAEGDVSQFKQNEANLQAGKNVGANPYLNPQYLSAVARLRSGALNQNANSATRDIRALNARTGGMNSTATIGATTDLALKKAQLGNQLGAEQTANDWAKNVGYQTQLAQAPLEAARAEGGLYNTATGGQADALKNLMQLQMASYGPWESAIQAMGGAAAGALGKKG